SLDAHRGLDHVRRVALALLADVLELRARVLGVLGEIEVAPVGDALELLPPDRIEVLDVARPARVVRALGLVVLADAQLAAAEAEVEVPLEPLLDPVPVPLLGLVRRHEVLHLHLLELAHAEEEVARGDLVAERLTDLRDAERRLAARYLEHVLEVDEDALCGLGPEVRSRAPVLHRAHLGLKHQVELARLGQIALGELAGPLARLAAAARVLEPVGAEAELAGAAVDERVAEAGDVA